MIRLRVRRVRHPPGMPDGARGAHASRAPVMFFIFLLFLFY